MTNYSDNPFKYSMFISFTNKLDDKQLEAIEQEVINYGLFEMLNRGELG